MVFDHVGTVTGKDLYDLLGAKTIEDYALTVNLDGVKDPKIVRDVLAAGSVLGDGVSGDSQLPRL